MSAIQLSGNTTVLRRLGKFGFAFFLAKGLLWLAAPFVFVWFA